MIAMNASDKGLPKAPGQYTFSLDDLPANVAHMISVRDEAVKRLIDERDAHLKARLEELGPGWSIGYRLKPAKYPVRERIGAPAIVALEWETHEVELIDGAVPMAHAGFSYVGLPYLLAKETDHAE